MSKTAKIILVFITISLLFPTVSYASTTVDEWLNNSQSEDSPSDEPAGDSFESPAEEGTTEVSSSTPSLAGMIVKLVFVLLLILGLIYGLLKFFNQKNKIFSRNRTMENLGGMNLAPNRSIQAVRIGEQVFILGVGDTVQMVTEVTDENTKSSLIHREQQTQASQLGKRWFTKFSKKDSESQSTSPSTLQFQQLFENQLNDMKQKSKQARRDKQEGSDHE